MTSARRQLRRANVQKRDWAHEVDVNKEMTNFHELVPEMAHKVRPSATHVLAPGNDPLSAVSFRA